MNNALSTFLFTFDDKVALERRASNLETRIERFETRIDSLSSSVVRPWKTARIERVQDRLAAAREELSFVNDELISYQDVVEEPRDSFSITLENSTIDTSRGERPYSTATVSILDSLFDDTFVSGDELSVVASATKRTKKGTRRYTSKFKTDDIDINEGEGGVGTITFGSQRLGVMATKYEDLTIEFIDGSGDTIFSQQWDSTNIV